MVLGAHRRRPGRAPLRSDRRWALEPDLRRDRRPSGVAGCCAARPSARCWRPPTTCAVSTASSPRSARPTCRCPPCVGLCTDDSVNGAPFYVMDFVDGCGHPLRGAGRCVRPRRPGPGIGESIVDVLAAIHAVDVDAVGLGDLGRKEDYVARQLKRWYSQFQGSDDQVPGARPAGGARGARPARRQHPRAGSRRDRARRLPPRQLHDRRRRIGRGGARLGDLHPRRPARRRRPAARVLDRPRRAGRHAAGLPPPPSTGSPARPSSSPATRSAPVATCRTSTSTSPSATGS